MFSGSEISRSQIFGWGGSDHNIIVVRCHVRSVKIQGQTYNQLMMNIISRPFMGNSSHFNIFNHQHASPLHLVLYDVDVAAPWRPLQAVLETVQSSYSHITQV